jgi:hypothetical protein
VAILPVVVMILPCKSALPGLYRNTTTVGRSLPPTVYVESVAFLAGFWISSAAGSIA